MPIAELFLSALLPVLFEKLASPELLNFARREGIEDLLKKWEKLLTSIDQVLVDAEDRQLTNDRRVKPWLEDLRDLAYDIEDLLDEFATESAENKSKAKPSSSQAHSLLPSCCFRLNPRTFMLDQQMRSKIDDMDRRLQDIITRKDSLSLRENDGHRSAYGRLDGSRSSSYLPEPCFVSREVEKMDILNLLTGEGDGRTHAYPEVIPIVGMGGVGKTALAQQVYNDARVTGYFEVKAWAYVSDDFDVSDITKKILEVINSDLSCKDKDLNWLQDKLKEHLSEKRFLVVLDDIWNEKYENWTSLLKPLQWGAKGSKIIITTRSLHVASIAGASPKTLQELSLDAGMTLFAFHALGVDNFDHHSDLEELGRKIVKKCKGLPLAVKTLAGMLRAEVNLHKRKAILNSKIWQQPAEILPALKLSYLHLPPNLRRCFAYCAILPRGYEIRQDVLINWWIAEGLVEGKKGKNRWNTGLNYFKELVSRSLFQQSRTHILLFGMHDLVNELAKLVAGATHFSSEGYEFQGNHSNAYLARHASFNCGDHITRESLKIYHRMQGLRSFISIKTLSFLGERFFLSQKVLSDLLSGLKYLRVLSLHQCGISEVPDCIGKLRHLTQLDLSSTDIQRLPKSIVSLYNLEALMLGFCAKLIELPEGMDKLINLRLLDITATHNLRATPQNIGNLVGLEVLSKFIVQNEDGSRLKELNYLKNLRKELSIYDLHKVQDPRDAKDADLVTKEGIRSLNMTWGEYSSNCWRNEEREAEVLDFLCPHQNLEYLGIFNYGGLEFPSWLGSPLYVNIVDICLNQCRSAKALPSLGQLPLLKTLYIHGLNAICRVGSEFYGTENPFPSLVDLQFVDMPLWEDWSHCHGTEEGTIVFPRLEYLSIRDCPMLMGRLPSQLVSLTRLRITSCPHMDASLLNTSLPSLNELYLEGCNEMVLKSMVNLTSLTTLVIKSVAELACLNHEFTSSLIKLENLSMTSCENLMYLWQEGDVTRNLACLTSLFVDSCPEFISFVPGEGDEMHTLSSLKILTIQNCPKFVSFPEGGIPTSVTSLKIEGCDILRTLPRGLSIHPDEPSKGSEINHVDMTSCLRSLTICKCSFLPASLFGEGGFLPATLEKLVIQGCRGVESLAEINLDRLQSLREITIGNCKNLRSLPQGLHILSHLTSLKLEDCPALELECFPPLPPSILKLELWRCPNIKSLPNQLRQLRRLQFLTIVGCESITRFPDGGLPPLLQALYIYDCRNMKQPAREWLTLLTSLVSLRFNGGVGGVGMEKDLVLPLPSSLLYLTIADMERVERLSSSRPSSLRLLQFFRCPKLSELPQDGLPPNLEQLWIKECGVLEKRCRKLTGCYWPLICEIPEVRFNGSLV